MVDSRPRVTISSRPRVVLPTGSAAFAWSAPGAFCFRAELDQDGDLSNQVCKYESGYQRRRGVGGGCAGWRMGCTRCGSRPSSEGGTFGPVTTHDVYRGDQGARDDDHGAPAGVLEQHDATFEFLADEPATFECRIDGGTPVACSSPWTRSGLLNGTRSV